MTMINRLIILVLLVGLVLAGCGPVEAKYDAQRAEAESLSARYNAEAEAARSQAEIAKAQADAMIEQARVLGDAIRAQVDVMATRARLDFLTVLIVAFTCVAVVLIGAALAARLLVLNTGAPRQMTVVHQHYYLPAGDRRIGSAIVPAGQMQIVDGSSYVVLDQDEYTERR
jgi:hypothetical protein